MKSGRTGERTRLTMRIFKGLENIHSVIDKHQAEWLRDEGEDPEQHKLPSVEERIRQRFAEGVSTGSGRFSADRFMGGNSGSVSRRHEPEEQSDNESSVEVVNVIQQKEERHSWLYKEVLKAINDSIGDRKNTKVIAVFIPVVQNGKEFESLPVDETVTIQTVNIDEPEHKPEEKPAGNEDFKLLPEGSVEPDVELAKAFQTIEKKLEDTLTDSKPESEPDLDEPLVIDGNDDFAELEAEPETLQEPEQETEHKAEPELELTEEHDDIFSVSEGEPLKFEEIEKTEETGEAEEKTEESEETGDIELPESLEDDDEVFDDAIFEEPLDTEEEESEETIIIEDPELKKD